MFRAQGYGASNARCKLMHACSHPIYHELHTHIYIYIAHTSVRFVPGAALHQGFQHRVGYHMHGSSQNTAASCFSSSSLSSSPRAWAPLNPSGTEAKIEIIDSLTFFFERTGRAPGPLQGFYWSQKTVIVTKRYIQIGWEGEERNKRKKKKKKKKKEKE